MCASRSQVDKLAGDEDFVRVHNFFTHEEKVALHIRRRAHTRSRRVGCIANMNHGGRIDVECHDALLGLWTRTRARSDQAGVVQIDCVSVAHHDCRRGKLNHGFFSPTAHRIKKFLQMLQENLFVCVYLTRDDMISLLLDATNTTKN